MEGLRNIVAIKAEMNLGLSETLIATFSDVAKVPLKRLRIFNKKKFFRSKLISRFHYGGRLLFR